MVVIKVDKVKSGAFKKKVRHLQNFLKDPFIGSSYNSTIKNLKTKWSVMATAAFYVRRDVWHMRCDGLIAKALGVKIVKRNQIVVYVEPVTRFIKGHDSSGGPVRNLTSLLFRGTKQSDGAYYARWDARTQSGIHRGISSSPMRNLWKRFHVNVRENIREAINRGLARSLKK